MIFSSGYKERHIEAGAKVLVYRNLNNGLWSVKAVEGMFKGKVVGHFKAISLVNVDDGNMIKLSKKSQERARRERTRNVHAYIFGNIVAVNEEVTAIGKRITYIPFIHDNFIIVATGNEWDGAGQAAHFTNGQCYIA